MSDIILRNEPLTHPWAGTDPFLFCAHHLDHYPAADQHQAVPSDHIGTRPLGNDFSHTGGFNMYYGTSVPGFPAHPHRGFETITIVPKGVVDHADSLGATARYGDGDVQWLTAGRGVMHSEMFPLRDTAGPNTLDLYQIWLNLPARSKMSDPAFVMLWDSTIPRYQFTNAAGSAASVKIISGAYTPQEANEATIVPPPPAPDSYASDPAAEVAIWQVSLEAGANITLPPTLRASARRTLYVHEGTSLNVDSDTLSGHRLIEVKADAALSLSNPGPDSVDILLLQGVPIEEPVVAQGPFVMNTQAEIDQARRDFGRSQFGGWPWEASGPVHANGQGRFAHYPGEQTPQVPPPTE